MLYTPNSCREEQQVPGTKTRLTYQHCGRKIKELEIQRLLTFTGQGSVRNFETGLPTNPGSSISLTEVSELRGTGAAVVEGVPVNRDGSLRKNGNPRRLIVSEGSFLVWW